MQQYVIDRYSDDILNDIAARYDTTPDSLKRLDGWESFIYEYENDGKGYILRISHSDRYSIPHVHGEIDWINHLAQGGARVAQAIPSRNGNAVETLEDGHGAHFVAAAYTKAAGDFVKEWTPEFMQHYGETMGQLHRLTTSYQLSNPAWTHQDWDSPKMLDFESDLKQFDAQAWAAYQPIRAHLDALPRDDTYMVTHQDAHTGNLFVDEQGKITLFDFADCGNSWLSNDIAMVFFYALAGIDRPDDFMENFMQQFMLGYRREYDLSAQWLAEIPYFMKMREIELYITIERDMPDWKANGGKWINTFMDGRRTAIHQQRPFIDYDFAQLATMS